MQDFAYLFGDSAAAWLRGRGDARFPHYERHYRVERQAMPETFASLSAKTFLVSNFPSPSVSS